MRDTSKELSSADIQRISNGILKYIKKVCDENQIDFYLGYGTALGAVRHRGFIPWDDDVDIIVTRENYTKLSDVLEKNPDERYQLLYLDSPNYNMPLPKMVDNSTEWIQTTQKNPIPLGVYVDIFILDRVPLEKRIQASYLKKLGFLQKLWSINQFQPSPKNLVKKITCRILNCILSLIGARRIAQLLDKYSQKYASAENCLYSPLIFSVYGRQKELMPESVLGKGTLVTFEGKEYLIPEKYDEYLTNLYGNYMQLPPEEKRVSHHNHKAYWK